MIALIPILTLIAQFAPAVITIVAQVIEAIWGVKTPVVSDHPVVSALISGFLLPSPIARR